MFLAGSQGDIETFESLASRFIRRFPTSYYLSDFLRKFSYFLVKLDFNASPRPIERMAPLIERLSRKHQVAIYLAVARGAVLDGNVGLEKIAGNKVLALYSRPGKVTTRARLYLAASLIVTDKMEEAVASLEKLDMKLLDNRDRKLLQAARVTARAIMEEPELSAMEDRDKADTSLGKQAGDTIAKAEKILESARKLLKDTSR